MAKTDGGSGGGIESEDERWRAFGFIISIGGLTTNETVVDNYYIGQCGFDPNQTHDVHIPNCNGFYEIGSLAPSQLNAVNAGKKNQIDLINFRGLTIQQSVAILTNRNPAVAIDLSTNSAANTKLRLVGNVYDPDGSRVELDDEWGASGGPG